MRRQLLAEADLERHLLRLSLGSLHAERLCCHRCGRTPLVGEVVYRYPRERTICALCRPSRRDEPLAAVPVRHGEEIRAQRISAPRRDPAVD
ncbi:MAG: hypothetical protein M0P31_14835 [Solirubrobacteraceae bacterium]|nr:hypothetical protein [Solirubrobacteraceae bacterium]